jgi:AcrR family transcriptional regulator
MNEVAQACGLSKATLYHYYDDKYSMLVSIAEGHVQRLHALVAEVTAERLPPEAHLRELINRIVEEYAGAQHAHRVLTEDVRFLNDDDRARVLGKEREVVAGFARAVTALRPDLKKAKLAKPMTMLLFGMINWMFTWLKPEGSLDHASIAPIVADLFLGGLPAVKLPRKSTATVD